ncbi:hypothetical protein NGRA_3300 [Nosema granulosis]|uniref:Uncharacterized protein n=1 Tax=Nosema granulosis TaxID=83296 RepID=A0A9P6GY86_9MICR|nr:hypothetical protein NGRA_3300 [Nosema granulosis]
MLANGIKGEIKEKHTVVFKDINNEVTSKEDFYVIPSLPYDGILGQQFLKKHKYTICFKKGTIGFKNDENNPVDPDEVILNKIYSPYSKDNNPVKSIVENYKRKNPTLGLIKGKQKIGPDNLSRCFFTSSEQNNNDDLHIILDSIETSTRKNMHSLKNTGNPIFEREIKGRKIFVDNKGEL